MEPIKNIVSSDDLYKITEEKKISEQEEKVDNVAKNTFTPVSGSQSSLSSTQHAQLNASRLKSERSERLTRISKQWFRNENEPDIEEEMENALDEVLNSNLCEIPSDSPFINTDLVILKDGYRGQMPINAIKETEFKKISALFNDICAGKTKIKIDDTDLILVEEVHNAITILLTRQIGRELIMQVCNRQTDLLIQRGETNKYNPQTNELLLDLNDIYRSIEMHPSGKSKISSESPLYHSLGHELIHSLQPNFTLARNLSLSPTLGEKYDNLEEQVTITGLENNLASRFTDSDDSWEPIAPKGYHKLNERNLVAAFVGGENVWYPRVGHHGQLPKDRVPFATYIRQLIQEDVAWDLQQELKDKTINVYETLAPDSPLTLALNARSLDVAKLFIDPAKNTKAEIETYVRLLIDTDRAQDLKELKEKTTINLNEILAPDSPLFLANSLAVAKIFIDSATKGEIKDYMEFLIRKNKAQDLKELLNNSKINLNKIIAPDSPLTLALKAQSPDVLKMLINNPLINTKTERIPLPSLLTGENKLNNNLIECLDILFEAHSNIVDINATDLHGESILHHLVISQDKEGIKKFLEWGGDLQLKNQKGQIAVEVLYSNLESMLKRITKLMLWKEKDKWNKKLQDAYECIKLMTSDTLVELADKGIIIQHIIKCCDYEVSTSIIDSLKQHNYDFNKVDNLGNSLLHYMMAAGNKTGVQKILQFGGDPKLKNKDEHTPIELAFMEINETLLPRLNAMKNSYFRERIMNIGECIQASTKEELIIDEAIQANFIKELLKLGDPEFESSFLKLVSIKK
jgi:ankyrin repeat protein